VAKRKRNRSIKTVIKNYGLMWRRDSVFWGKGNRKGVLGGRRSGKVIDFRDRSACMCFTTKAGCPSMWAKRGKAVRACSIDLEHTGEMDLRIVGTILVGLDSCRSTKAAFFLVGMHQPNASAGPCEAPSTKSRVF